MYFLTNPHSLGIANEIWNFPNTYEPWTGEKETEKKGNNELPHNKNLKADCFKLMKN